MKTGRIYNLIIGSVVLTLGTIILSYYQEEKNKEALHWVNHSYEVLYQAAEFLSVVRDAEAGQRGYLISGDTTYLKPYYNAEKNLLWHFNDLKNLVADNPQQQGLLIKKVQPVMELKTMLLKRAIVANDTHGRDSAFAIIRTNAGKKAMDSLKHYMYILSEREHGLLRDRQAHLDSLVRIVDITRNVSLSFIIIISLLGLLSLYNKQRSNSLLLLRLQSLNNHLEDLVAKRTNELEEKNKAYEATNEELHQSMEELTSLHDSLQLQNRLTQNALLEVNDLYENSPCGYHSSDADNVIIRMNQTELTWLGYSREEIIGKIRYRDLLSPESKEGLPRILEEFRLNGKVIKLELDIIRKDGTILPVLLSASAIMDEEGKFIMSRTAVFDQTDRKKLQNEIKEANDKMLHIMNEKNTFLAMASHDLKSPLNSIQGLLNLFKLGSENLTADQKDNLQLVNGAASNMRAMIDKLLDLNRIEQGKSMVQKKEIDLIEVILRTRMEAQTIATRKKIQILTDGIPSTLRIVSDVTILHQILENLISNAVKFSPPDKKVWLSVKPGIDTVCLQIADEGPGIRAEESHKVFGRFQKLSARPTGGETSTGLGLSIVKQLVTALDGTITFESEPGVRTVFTVTLPVN